MIYINICFPIALFKRRLFLCSTFTLNWWNICTMLQKKPAIFLSEEWKKPTKNKFILSRPGSTIFSETGPGINSFFLKWLSRSSVITWLCGRLSMLSWNGSDTSCILCKNLLFHYPIRFIIIKQWLWVLMIFIKVKFHH